MMKSSQSPQGERAHRADVPELHAAIDLGASSVRLFAGRLDRGRLDIREVCRMPNGPVHLPGGIHWDLLGAFWRMLEALGQLSREAVGSPISVGIDGWGVDYGLLDPEGRLLGLPYHYRDSRTTGRLQELDALVGLERLYEATGIQEMELNTVCQLLAERTSAAYAVASQLLMVPDLFAFWLTGEGRFERTNASTTQLIHPTSGSVLGELLQVLGLRSDLFAPPINPGEHYGRVLPAVGASGGIAGPVWVVSVASHDTASAVLGVPAEDDSFANVVNGNWSIVGLELDTPVVSQASHLAGFSNESGYGGTVQFQKNVMGHWMLQECLRCWAQEGRSASLVDLIAQAEPCTPFRCLVDTTEAAFTVPGNMPHLIRHACRRDGEPVPESDAQLVRCVLDSMALAICQALEDGQTCSGKFVRSVHVVGGGAANRLLLSLIAGASGLDVVAGPTEASAVGNVLVQLHATRKVKGKDEMRQLVARSFPPVRVKPDRNLAQMAQRVKDRWVGQSRPRQLPAVPSKGIRGAPVVRDRAQVGRL